MACIIALVISLLVNALAILGITSFILILRSTEKDDRLYHVE